MAEASTVAHPVFCLGEIPKVYFSSDNVCKDCCARCYLLEKRYQITKIVQAAGGRTTEIGPLSAAGVMIWRIWRRDWEKFRAIGVFGGDGGELGQGWSMERSVVLGKMMGFPEIYKFDPFLGAMGPFELEGPPLGMLGAEEEYAARYGPLAGYPIRD